MGIEGGRQGGPAAVSPSTAMLQHKPMHSRGRISCQQNGRLSAVLLALAGMTFLACQLDTVTSQLIRQA